MSKSIRFLSMALFLLLAAAGCKKGHDAHWGYEGDIGPQHWGDLSKEFIACKEGKSQSPINIAGEAKETAVKLGINYSDTALDIVNNGHAIQVNYGGASTLTIDNEEYKLLQFHFHAPSEGAVNGKLFDLCAHLVHKSAAGKLAVIAVYFNRGAENGFLKSFWDRIPKKSGEKVSGNSVTINVKEMLPEKKSFYHYIGSLTTPPCSEGVKWFVMDNIVPISEAQLKTFTDIFAKNTRPLQQLNGRTIYKSK